MSLPVTAYLDSSTFLNGGYFSTVGEYPSCKPPNITGYRRAFAYYDRLDCIVQREYNTVHGNRYAVRLDANFFDNSANSCKWANAAEPGTMNSMALGEWDMILNTQKFYWSNTETEWKELDVDNMSDDGVVYSGIIGPRGQRNGLTYPGDSYSYDGSDSGQVLFETLGYALVVFAQANIPGGAATASYRPILVDLTTGNAVADVPFYTRYTASPTDAAESQPFKGESFDLEWVQFVPDDDSTPANPKGYLLLSQSNAALDGATWVKQVDWNPNGVAAAEGQPTRTHCQTRTLSKFQPTQGSWPGACPVADSTHQCLLARRSDDTWLCVWGTDLDGPHNAGDCGRMVVGQQATPVVLTRPVAIGRPKTNSIATFVSTFVGDLGERVSGVSATWALKKASEYREELPTTATPDEYVSVDNPPIDDEHEYDVFYDDSPLTEGVHYSLSAGAGDPDAGIVQFISPHTMSGVYEMRYRHLENPVEGARGNLLTPAAKSDDYGNVYARVRIDDDDTLVGEWENISAEEA